MCTSISNLIILILVLFLSFSRHSQCVTQLSMVVVRGLILVVFVVVKNLILHANSYKDTSYYKVSGRVCMRLLDLGFFFLLKVIDLFSSLHASPSMT